MCIHIDNKYYVLCNSSKLYCQMSNTAHEKNPHLLFSLPTGKTLSGGQVAGIVIGLIGFIVIVAAIVFIIRRRRLHQPLGPFVENASGFDNALYRKSEETEEVSLSSNGSTGVSNGSNRIALGHADAEDC